MSITKKAFQVAAIVATLFVASNLVANDPIVGNWLGYAEPAPGIPGLPFREVHYQYQFFEDGTVKFSDGHIAKFDHGDGSGYWKKTGANSYQSDVVLFNYDDPNGGGSDSVLTIRWAGEIDGDNMDGTLNIKSFPADSNPTNFDNPGGVSPFPTVTVQQGRRVEFQPEPGESLVPELDRSGVPLSGAWFGKAVPRLPVPGVPEVVMMLNFYPDGNMGPSDVLENRPGLVHATAHGGPWRLRDDGIVEGMFVWQNLADGPNPFLVVDNGGYAKVRITGRFDVPDTNNTITGTVRPRPVLPFPAGDPLSPVGEFPVLGTVVDDMGNITAENTFDIVELTRIGDDSQSLTSTFPNQDYGDHPTAGKSWYGKALPADPATAEYAEIFITPSFGDHGNLWMNDSQQEDPDAPHGTIFGNWVPRGGGGFEAIGIWQDFYTPEQVAEDPENRANNFRGGTKVIFSGEVDPSNPNVMSGEFDLYHFPASVIDLPHTGPEPRWHADPDNTGGVFLGTYTFDNLVTVPEPMSAAIAVMGLLGLLSLRRRPSRLS